MPMIRRLLLASAATVLAVGGGIVAWEGDDEAGADAGTTSTPLASFDTSEVTVVRTAFCDRVAGAAVRAALGAEPEDAKDYANGDPVRLAAGVRDRAHEYGCSWTAAGTTAAAWVFAPPVSRGTAGALLRQARGERGCEPVRNPPAYGDPSAGLVCTTPGSREVSFRGLFGDSWLACSLRTRDVSAGQSVDEVMDRTGRWCVAVAQAARAPEAER